MKKKTIAEFGARANDLLSGEEPVFVVKDGKTIGVYLPLEEGGKPSALRMELFEAITNKIGKQLDAQGITEEQLLEDFEASRKARR